MGCIHTHDVHACEEQLADEILPTSPVAYGAYNLCLFHILALMFVSANLHKKIENMTNMPKKVSTIECFSAFLGITAVLLFENRRVVFFEILKFGDR